jgi:(1->4)-alpha-D-glucan 1-alpha-D-glucosylmutase
METMTQENSIQQLAQAYGIQPDWTDIWGNRHPVTDEMYKALLSAMEVSANSQVEIDIAFSRLEHATVARWLEPVLVVPETDAVISIPVHLPSALGEQPLQWFLVTEDGARREGVFTAADLRHISDVILASGHHERVGRFEFDLEGNLPQGYHQFSVTHPETRTEVGMLLVVTPTQCYLPSILEEPAVSSPVDGVEPAVVTPSTGKVWGPAVQLYAVHSNRNWGMGDFSDLLRVIDWCVEQGAALVGLNPLHALFPHNPSHSSPYSPSSRMFFNVMYLDPETVADFQESAEAKQLVFSPAFQNMLEKLRDERLVPYAEAGQRKLDVLELLYLNFCQRHLSQNTSRAQAFRTYVEEHGRLLERFALFHALQERFHKEDPSVWGWPAWPEAYQDPDSPAVQEFLHANRERVEFYQYLQWQVDIQLQEVGLRCLKNNLGIGLYMDMAVGVDRGGADVWANQHLFAKSSAVGAPPDEYNQKGQDWGLPPLIPEKMREEAYVSFIEILRQNMQHAGALRIDHVMGLMRLFWIPPGLPPSQGAYIHYSVDELFGILALESQRNQCMVIGEDMGTVPEVIRDRMERWGVYSYKVFYFEKLDQDSFKQPEAYVDMAAVAISTHDLPTLSGFWQGQDIAVRTELDLYPSKELRDRQITDRVMERVAILRLLEERSLLPGGISTDPLTVPQMTPELAAAIHRLVAQTASKIFMVQFEDMLQQVDQINLPGTTDPVYPCWKRKLTLPLEELFADERVRKISAIIAEERPRQMGRDMQQEQAIEHAARLAMMIPSATYRFQFNKDFTFRQAAELVPYLQKLGITHCYASPLLKAREGSPHGYDITDHKQLNHEIGSREDFEHLAHTLKAHGMGLVLDIVPNHMGAGKDNPWWMDVLENGLSSLYADYFDIDWHPLVADLQNKILLPILGDAYGKILRGGELKLRFESETSRFWLDYYAHEMPINPVSYPTILEHRLAVLEVRLGKTNPAFLEYRSIISAFERLPVVEENNNLDLKEERARERMIAMNRLTTLRAQSPEVNAFIVENVLDFQPQKDNTTNQNRLHRLLEQQVYRLSNWRVASDEINYRRFFDINDLVAVRVEDQRVFNDTHELVLELVEQGLVTGLRIDHPDGLYDPAAYFQRLQDEAAKRLDEPIRSDWQLGSDALPLYVLIEKILAPFERLPQEWMVHGTTGYEFVNSVNGIFVKQENEKELTRIYERLRGQRIDFEDLVYQCKRLIMKSTLNSELGVLTQQLKRISKQNWSFRDFTLHNLRDALIEVVACFPVYRTYVTPDSMSKKDREYIDWAVRLAKRRSLAIDTSIFDFVRSVLLLEAVPEGQRDIPESAKQMHPKEVVPADEAVAFRRAMIRFAMKFQQYTAPVMAKGLEDTSFYRYNRLVSLNEVGGDPRQFGISLATFHHQNSERAKRVPYTLLATSTHDTKRSEDARARISVLSEMPDEWQKHVSRWRRMNRHWRRSEDGEQTPSVNAEYLFYQTLVGIWPLETPTPEEIEALAERIEQYMLKAVRESKSHTSWINPNTAYEESLSGYIRGVLLRPSKLFLDDFLPFQKIVARFGLYNSLSQTLLKLTCPGVPDIYQGSELWHFALVDPDNRRPVDYQHSGALMEQVLTAITEENPTQRKALFEDMMDEVGDARIKQALIATVLRYRAAHRELFQRGSYIPLDVVGTHSEHIVAFARQWQDMAAIVVVPRLLYDMGLRRTILPCGKRVWKDTAIVIPESLYGGGFENLFTKERTGKRDKKQVVLEVADILTTLPFGMLVRE